MPEGADPNMIHLSGTHVDSDPTQVTPSPRVSRTAGSRRKRPAPLSLDVPSAYGFSPRATPTTPHSASTPRRHFRLPNRNAPLTASAAGIGPGLSPAAPLSGKASGKPRDAWRTPREKSGDEPATEAKVPSVVSVPTTQQQEQLGKQQESHQNKQHNLQQPQAQVQPQAQPQAQVQPQPPSAQKKAKKGAAAAMARRCLDSTRRPLAHRRTAQKARCLRGVARG